jgi:hypothetical protein
LIFATSTISDPREKLNTKFMQTLEKEVYMDLKTLAKERGVTVQEFLRAVVVPDWMRSYNGGERRSRSKSG